MSCTWALLSWGKISVKNLSTLLFSEANCRWPPCPGIFWEKLLKFLQPLHKIQGVHLCLSHVRFPFLDLFLFKKHWCYSNNLNKTITLLDSLCLWHRVIEKTKASRAGAVAQCLTLVCHIQVPGFDLQHYKNKSRSKNKIHKIYTYETETVYCPSD
jgi:hypothetical protein